MPRSFKKETVKLSFDQKERALAILRALVRSQYFGDHIPGDAELSRKLRIPRSSLILAINQLVAQHILEPSRQSEGWDVCPRKVLNDMGEVLFVVNIDPLQGWFSLYQDWLIGFEGIMHDERYHVRLLSGFSSLDEKIEAIQKGRDQGAMGVALASRTEPQVRQAILQTDIPAVILGNSTFHEEELGCVCTDNFSGISKAIEFLISRHHRRISMYVTGLGIHDGFEQRFQAYQNIMKHHHLASHNELAFSEAHNDLTARRAADILLRMKSRPTAVLCGSDREAFELVSELRHLKIRVPEDISVIGFDNNHFGSLLEPPMTTIDIYAANMGQIAAHYLLNEMQAPQLPVKMLLPTELVIRTSVTDVEDNQDPSGIIPPSAGESARILGF